MSNLLHCSFCDKSQNENDKTIGDFRLSIADYPNSFVVFVSITRSPDRPITR